MSDGAEDRSALIGRLADELAIGLSAAPLLEVDFALDEARRFMFTKVYSGFRDARVQAQLSTPRAALAIAAKMEGTTLDEAQEVLAIVRRTLWSSHFATIPETKLGREFAAYMAGAPSPDASRKLN
jgi:hypothetical protein